MNEWMSEYARLYIPAHVVGDEREQYASDKYPECNADRHDNQYPCRIAKQIDNITRPAVLFYLVETIETARCKVSLYMRSSSLQSPRVFDIGLYRHTWGLNWTDAIRRHIMLRLL